MNNDTATASQKPQSFMRYGAILGLLAVIRVFELTTAEASWRQAPYDSTISLALICLFAVGVSLFVCVFAKRHFSRPVAILLAMLAGGTTTLIVSSIPGMAIGLVVGGLSAFEVTQRLSLRFLRFVGVFAVPAAFVGLGIGFFGARAMVLRVETAKELQVAICVCMGLLVATVLWTFLIARSLKHSTRIWNLSGFLFFYVVSILFVPVGIQIDTQRRIAILNKGSVYSFASDLVVPKSGYENLIHGIWEPTYLGTDYGLTAEQGKLAAAFRSIHSVYSNPVRKNVSGPNYHTAGFSQVDFGKSRSLYIASPDFDDKALLAFRDSALISEIHLQSGSDSSLKVTDNGLAALKKMKWLNWLLLQDAKQIDGSGLQYLHPQAPLTMVVLNGTNVDDDALRHLANFGIAQLLLRRTRVTGEGLRHLRHDVPGLRLSHLDLGYSSFDEQFMELIPDSVSSLKLDGNKLTADGLETLVCRFMRSGLTVLSINDCALDDAAVRNLKHLSIQELHVDATHLTLATCDSLSHVPEVELVYEIEKWLAHGKSLDDLVAHFMSLRNELLSLKKNRRTIPAAIGGDSAVKLGIRGLVVSADMVDSLVELKNCQLYDAIIDSGEAYVEGERRKQTLEPEDLRRWFPATENLD